MTSDNATEAQHYLDTAQTAFQAGRYYLAEKSALQSLQLHPTPAASALLKQLQTTYGKEVAMQRDVSGFGDAELPTYQTSTPATDKSASRRFVDFSVYHPASLYVVPQLRHHEPASSSSSAASAATSSASANSLLHFSPTHIHLFHRTYPRPAWLQIPPSQRKPLQTIYVMLVILLIMRWLGFMSFAPPIAMHTLTQQQLADLTHLPVQHNAAGQPYVVPPTYAASRAGVRAQPSVAAMQAMTAERLAQHQRQQQQQQSAAPTSTISQSPPTFDASNALFTMFSFFAGALAILPFIAPQVRAMMAERRQRQAAYQQRRTQASTDEEHPHVTNSVQPTAPQHSPTEVTS